MFQITTEKGPGYRLIDKGNMIYQLQTPRGFYTGTIKDVSRYAVKKLGFDVDEFFVGVIEMEANFHNAAEYGILKRFIFTFDVEENDATAIRH